MNFLSNAKHVVKKRLLGKEEMFFWLTYLIYVIEDNDLF